MYKYQVILDNKEVKSGTFEECYDWMLNYKGDGATWELRQVPVAIKLSIEEVSLYWNGAGYNHDLA